MTGNPAGEGEGKTLMTTIMAQLGGYNGVGDYTTKTLCTFKKTLAPTSHMFNPSVKNGVRESYNFPLIPLGDLDHDFLRVFIFFSN